METLKQAFITYLCYDMLSNNEWQDPSPKNKKHHELIAKDAERLAKLAMQHLSN